MASRMIRTGLAIASGILMLIMAGAWASAQNTNGAPEPFRGGRGRGGPGGPGGAMGFLEPFPMLASQLGLSDTQMQQIKSIATSHADEWKALLDKERAARQALQTAIASTQFDELTIRQRSAELAAVEADAAVARARARAEAIALLTADQQAKLKEIESQPLRARGRGPRGQ